MSVVDTVVPMDTDSQPMNSAFSEVEANIPNFNVKVYKDECLYCYDSPYSEGKVDFFNNFD